MVLVLTNTQPGLQTFARMNNVDQWGSPERSVSVCAVIFLQLSRAWGSNVGEKQYIFGYACPNQQGKQVHLLLSSVSSASQKTSPGGRADWASWYSPAPQMRQQEAERKQMGPHRCWTDVICRQLCLLCKEHTAPQFANVTDELLLSLQLIVKNCLLLITGTWGFCGTNAVMSSSNE